MGTRGHYLYLAGPAGELVPDVGVGEVPTARTRRAAEELGKYGGRWSG